MADFPPNPEDGELWLPSDVFHEIVSATNRPEKSYSHQAFIENAALNHVAIQRKSSAVRSLSEVVSRFQFLRMHFFLSALFSNSVVSVRPQTAWLIGYSETFFFFFYFMNFILTKIPKIWDGLHLFLAWIFYLPYGSEAIIDACEVTSTWTGPSSLIFLPRLFFPEKTASLRQFPWFYAKWQCCSCSCSTCFLPLLRLLAGRWLFTVSWTYSPL